MTFIQELLAPPIFDDEEKTQRAYLLHSILLALLIVPIPFVIYVLIQRPEESDKALAWVMVLEFINTIPFVLLKRGHVRSASVTQTVIIWLFFAAISVTSSGIYGASYLLGNGLVIIISGILLGGRGTLGMTLLAVIEGGVMLYAELHGWTPPDILDAALPTWIVSIVLFSAGAVLQQLASRTLRMALARARESEEKYRLISQVGSDYTYATEIHSDGSASLSWVTGAFEQMTGYTFEEYVASGSWLAHVHPDDLEKDAQDMENLRNNQDIKSEIRTYSKSGEIRWERIFAHPIWNEKENRLAGIVGAVQDITEQKQIEAALAYERDILQIFMDNIPDLIYFKDASSRFLRINQAQAHFLGVDNPQDAIGKTDLDFQNPELARELLAEEKLIMETGQPLWNHIEFNPTKDGTPRWLSTTKVPAKNELGKTIGTIGISRNITEQKNAEEIEQNHRAMLENVIRLGKLVTEANDLNTTLEKIWHGVHEDLQFDRLAIFLYNAERNSLDRALGTDMRGKMEKGPGMSFPLAERSRIAQVLDTPDGLYFTHDYDNENNIPQDGEMYGVKDFASVAVWAGEKPIAVICVDHLLTKLPISGLQLEALRLFAGYAGLAIENTRLNTALQDELTQHKETLIQQSAILNGIPDMAWLKDKDSRYIAINEQFAKTAGMKMEEITGKTDFDIWPANFAKKYRNDDLEVIKTRQRKSLEEFQVDSTGKEYWVETTKTPILNQVGEVNGTTGIAREITRRKQAEEFEQQRRIMLEKVVQLGKRVTESDNLRATIKKIWHGVHDDLGFDRLAIFLVNAEHNTMDDTVGTNNAGEMVDHWDLSFPIESTFAVLLQKPDGVYFTHNYDVENDIPQGSEMYGIKDYAAVAAWAGDKPVAVICADHGITQRGISPQQLEALRLFGGYAGLAIENARLNEKVQDELAQQIQAKEWEERRREILEKIIKLGQRVTEVHDLRTTLIRIWHGVRDDLGFGRLGIYLYNPEKNSMDGTFGTNNQGKMVDEWNRSYPVDFTFADILHNPNGMYFTHNYAVENNIPEGHDMYGVKDYVAVAAWAGDKPVAVICADHGITQRAITIEQLEALRLFGGYASLAIENARLNEKVQDELSQQIQAKEREKHRREILERVIALGQRITEVQDLRTTLMTIWRGIHDDLEFDRLGIYLYNHQRGSMDGTFGTNNQGEMIDEWHVWFSLEEDNRETNSFLHVFQKPDAIFLTHSFADDYNIPEGHNMSGVKDHASIGAWAGEKPVAVISVDNRITGRPFREEQLEALQLFAGYAGLAIENARLNSSLENELALRKSFIVELEVKNAELERFTYTVSHDLKSPLVTIRGFLGYLERDSQEGNYEKFKHDKQRIETAVEKMQDLLKDLLELSRIGRLMNAQVEIPFNEIVKDALEILHGQTEAGSVLVDHKNNDIIIKCDRVRLTEVMQNLVDNAIKFMGDQPNPRIEIGAFLNENNENVFYVKDNGMGIAPEFQEKIFGLFNKLKPESEGTGIGLTLVKRIIELHKGRIWVESQVGMGTTFYFTLP